MRAPRWRARRNSDPHRQAARIPRHPAAQGDAQRAAGADLAELRRAGRIGDGAALQHPGVLPLPYRTGSDSYSDDSAYWQFRSLTALASADPDKYLPLLRGVWSKESSKLYQEVALLDQSLKQAYASDKATAIGLAADYSYGQLEQTYQMAKELRYKLMTDLTKRTEQKYSPEEFKKIMSL